MDAPVLTGTALARVSDGRRLRRTRSRARTIASDDGAQISGTYADDDDTVEDLRNSIPFSDTVARLPAHRSSEGTDPTVHLRVFDPCGQMTLVVTEFDREERVFIGFMGSPLRPHCDELGYASLDELEAVTNRPGLGLERDLW